MGSDTNFINSCDCNAIHEKVILQVKNTLPNDDDLQNLGDMLKIFGDKTRLKILFALLESQMCVCDISVLLNMTKSAISHQLRVLKQSKLVKFKKVGQRVYYSICDDHVKHILDQGLEHIKE